MSNSRYQNKKKVAVFFGGRSPEHDVSVITGLQVLSALDTQITEAFPVYVTREGEWLTGDVLRERSSYMLSTDARKQVTSVTLDIAPGKKARLIPKTRKLFGHAPEIEFDVALPAFHGLFGEDGAIQGLFDFAGVAYTGMRALASAILMDKAATKLVMRGLDIPVLPYAVLKRPEQGLMLPKEEIAAALKDSNIGFPCIVKPNHLGSSIGVAKVNALEEVPACLPAIFEYDTAAIVEPYVENLVEYNVAVAGFNGETRISAIERPKTHDELLDFKQKYMSGGDNKTGNKTGTKSAGTISEGMLSLTRELNPDLDSDRTEKIKAWAIRMFQALDGTGAPRIDYIGNSKTGEVWLNEVNPCPGSFGYFLWEAAEDSILFTDLLTALIEEALAEKKKQNLPADPVPKDARLLPRVS